MHTDHGCETINGQRLRGQCLANLFNNYLIDMIDSNNSSDVLSHMRKFLDSLFFFPASEDEVLTVFENLMNSISRDAEDRQIAQIRHVLKLIYLA